MEPQISQPAASQPSTKKSALPLRTLVINLLFSMFTALVIFTVASYYFLVPQIARQDLELRKLQNQISAMNERAAARPEAAAEEPDTEPEAEAAAPGMGIGEAASDAQPSAGRALEASTGMTIE